MDWFERLTGIDESVSSYADVQSALAYDGEMLRCPNGRTYRAGRLEIVSLGDLRSRALGEAASGRLRLGEVVADVVALHSDPTHADALFQVASQFNLLEMIGPEVTPEDGLARYADDWTQGPACAMAAGAGTAVRNYLVPLDGGIGQTVDRQIDTTDDLARALGDGPNPPWSMRNGYLTPGSRESLRAVGARLRSVGPTELDALRALLKVGVMWQTQVTFGEPSSASPRCVSQVYASAVPIAYSDHPDRDWEPLARLVLEAAYEATLAAAVLNRARHGSSRVFLTLLGGGAFGNPTSWIVDALERALARFVDHDLEVEIVSHGSSRPEVAELVETFESR